MYHFKKLALISRKQKLLKIKGKFIIKQQQELSSWSYYNAKIKAIDIEIEGINEILEYLQNEKPVNTNKINNTSVNVGAKNESGTHIELPSIIEK